MFDRLLKSSLPTWMVRTESCWRLDNVTVRGDYLPRSVVLQAHYLHEPSYLQRVSPCQPPHCLVQDRRR